MSRKFHGPCIICEFFPQNNYWGFFLLTGQNLLMIGDKQSKVKITVVKINKTNRNSLLKD